VDHAAEWFFMKIHDMRPQTVHERTQIVRISIRVPVDIAGSLRLQLDQLEWLVRKIARPRPRRRDKEGELGAGPDESPVPLSVDRVAPCVIHAKNAHLCLLVVENPTICREVLGC
jgi:hypothetical protein